MTQPTQTPLRRSPVHDLLEHSNPTWGDVHGMPVALGFKSLEIENQKRGELSLCDVSCFPKLTLKGPDTLMWLQGAGIFVPENVYEYSQFDGGGLIIRTDRQEAFIEDGPKSYEVPRLLELLSAGAANVHKAARQDACFFLTGAKANEVLVETCGYDFRQPGDRLVMTRLAGVSCALLLLETNGVTGFRVWLDPSYGAYLWKALLEIVQDHGGDVVGMACHYEELVLSLRPNSHRPT